MKQSNFEFLKGVNDILYRMAQSAEKNYPDDPNTTLFKLRLYGEHMAKHLGKILDIRHYDRQLDLVRELAKIRDVDPPIINAFTVLRRDGNKAAHEYHNDLGDAQGALRLAFRLAVWYYRFVTKDQDFETPIFVLPTGQPDPHYQQQIEQLLQDKQKLQQQVAANDKNTTLTIAELASNKNQVTALNGLVAIMQSAREETQTQIDAREAAFNAQLKEKDAELAKMTEAARRQYKLDMNKQAASRKLELTEDETRFIIDAQLRKAGWQADSAYLKHSKGTRPQPGKNIAIAEWPTGVDETGNTGKADYLLFIGLTPVGVVEAKKRNIDVFDKLNEAQRYSRCFDLNAFNAEVAANDSNASQVAEMSAGYRARAAKLAAPTFFFFDKQYKIPFVYSANGRGYQRQLLTKSGIWHRDVRKNTNQAHALPVWHTPGELLAKLKNRKEFAYQWFERNPPTDLPLRYYQEEAVSAVEQAIAKGQRDILLAMATGTGKTRTAIALMYRVIESGCFERVLFLVDRRSLGLQALGAFDDTRIKENKFNSIFSIKGLTDKFPSDATKVHVSTIQSLVKRTLQSDEFMPTGRYDCIIVDEAHRGYVLDKDQTDGEMAFRNELDYVSTYRRILDHFDAVRIGLTATPALHTTNIFGLPVYRYSYRKAVIDGYLTDQEPPIKIITELAEGGVHLNAGTEVVRLTKQAELINDTLEDEQHFEVADFNNRLIASNFDKVVCKELAKHLNPTGDQKTLVFCVNNLHADRVVNEFKDAFKTKYPNLENDAVMKITGASDKDSNKVQSLITRFNKERLPNIVVTVDLLTTGIDVPSICNLVFMRKVKSRILYEQMKGRATRLCEKIGKVSFKIYDAVDLYTTLESVDTMKPVVIRPTVDMQTLVNEITDSETYKITEADGRNFAEHSHDQLVAKIQRVITHAKYHQDKNPEIDRSIKRFDEQLAIHAGCDFDSFARTLKTKGPEQTKEIFNAMPKMVERLEVLKQQVNELRAEPIFTDMPDKVIGVDAQFGLYNTPDDFLEAFDKLVVASENQQAALHTVLTKPKDLTRKALIELQEWFDAQSFDESALQVAWKLSKNQDIAARLIGHIRRAALGDALISFDERVETALTKLKAQNEWTPEQVSWLDRLGETIKQNVAIDDDTYKTQAKYKRRGGKKKLDKVFEGKLDSVLAQLNDYMWDQPA